MLLLVWIGTGGVEGEGGKGETECHLSEDEKVEAAAADNTSFLNNKE